MPVAVPNYDWSNPWTGGTVAQNGAPMGDGRAEFWPVGGQYGWPQGLSVTSITLHLDATAPGTLSVLVYDDSTDTIGNVTVDYPAGVSAIVVPITDPTSYGGQVNYMATAQVPSNNDYSLSITGIGVNEVTAAPGPDPLVTMDRGTSVLVKTKTPVILSPYVPPLAGIAAVSMALYATPPPLGYTYRQLASPAGFSNWSQLAVAPTQYTSKDGGFEYKTLAQLIGGTYGSVSIAGNWTPVYQQQNTSMGVQTVLVGYLVPVMTSVALPPRYYWPVPNMTYVTFPGVATAPNGYPLVNGVINGYVDIPTLFGIQRVNGTYAKDARGVWLQVGGDPPPMYTVIGGSAKVMMLSNFPGRQGVPARAAVKTLDLHPGWNAGANGRDPLDGDIRLAFDADISSAGIIGLAANAARDVTDYRNVDYGFYFTTASDGTRRACAMELGRMVSPLQPYGELDVFEILRADGAVSYLRAGTLVRVSSAPSGGPLLPATSLFLGGDAIGRPPLPVAPPATLTQVDIMGTQADGGGGAKIVPGSGFNTFMIGAATVVATGYYTPSLPFAGSGPVDLSQYTLMPLSPYENFAYDAGGAYWAAGNFVPMDGATKVNYFTVLEVDGVPYLGSLTFTGGV